MSGHHHSLPATCGLAVVAVLLVACSNGPIRGQAPTVKTAALSLRTAIVAGGPSTLSCHGGAFCRENVIAAGRADVLEEVTDDCTHRGGTASTSPCSRDGILASCSVTSGEAGPITVFTYAQVSPKEQAEAVSRMSKLCETFDGAFALTTGDAG